MSTIVQIIVTVFTAVLASSGVWTLIMKRMDRRDAKTKLLLGLAQNVIITRAAEYCRRGDWITEDEYSDLTEYLWKPYAELGGDGTAKKWMDRVEQRLIIVDKAPTNVHPNPYFDNV